MRPFGTRRARDTAPSGSVVPRYRGRVRVTFSAALSLRGMAADAPIGRTHGHDFTAEFVFEGTALIHPGVVVDTGVRTEIERHVSQRLAYRDLDRLFDRPPTCEAIAEYLANWHWLSARPLEHARLVAVSVSTGAGDYGEIRFPVPSESRC